MIWTFHFNLNEAIVRKGGKSLVRCSPLKLNERCEESCWRTSIFVSISRFIYSCTSWKLMPNDLGQPLNGRSEITDDLNMIYWITSQKERDVQGSTCG